MSILEPDDLKGETKQLITAGRLPPRFRKAHAMAESCRRIYNIPRSLQTQRFRPWDGWPLSITPPTASGSGWNGAIKAAGDREGLDGFGPGLGVAVYERCPANLCGVVDLGRNGQRHGARRGILGASNAPKSPDLSEEGLCGVLAHLQRPGPASPRPGRGQHLRSVGRTASLQLASTRAIPAIPLAACSSFAVQDATFCSRHTS